MSTMDRPEGNNNYHDAAPFDEDYRTALADLPMEKQFAMRTFVEKFEGMSREQLVSYAKAITAQKFRLEEVYKTLMKSEY